MTALIAQALRDPDTFHVGGVIVTIDDIITLVDVTGDDQWQTDVVRSEDGSRNCFFGHLYAHGQKLGDAARELQETPTAGALTVGEVLANALWEWFEECWSTTYVIYTVNDGQHPQYPQATPRDRVAAYLRALRDGHELRTQEAMALDAAASLERVGADGE